MEKIGIEMIKLIADEGMILTNGEVQGKEVYLSINDSVDNWWEISELIEEEIEGE